VYVQGISNIYSLDDLRAIYTDAIVKPAVIQVPQAWCAVMPLVDLEKQVFMLYVALCDCIKFIIPFWNPNVYGTVSVGFKQKNRVDNLLNQIAEV